MLVVSDSSPLNFLIRLHSVEILPKLFGGVLVPPEVEAELTRTTTPLIVLEFIASKPEWLQVRSPTRIENIPKLHPGEIAAISLAREVKADLVLIDDGDARKAAASRGLAVTGLLGVLERADERHLINLNELAPRLPTDYHIDRALVDAALDRRRIRQQAR
jgi:predicted nucleic acid-binding protein